MIKTFKKAIAIMLTLVFVLSLVPVSSFAADAEGGVRTTAKFVFCVNTSKGYENADRVDFGHAKKDDSVWAQKASWTGATSGDLYYGAQLSDQYSIFSQIDLSGYEEILRNESTTIHMNLRMRSTDMKHAISDHSAYFAPDNCDFIDFSSDDTMSYSIAKSAGFTNTDNLFYTNSDPTDVDLYSSGEISAENLIKALDSNAENSKVSLYFAGNGDNTTNNITRIRLTEDNTYFAITYDESEIDNEEYIKEVAGKLTWDKISSEPINSVSSTLNLPTKFFGATIDWDSDNAAVNPETGEVTVNPSASTEVTLTANLTYEAFNGTTENETKPFNITLPKEMYDYSSGTGTLYNGDDGSFMEQSGDGNDTLHRPLVEVLDEELAGKSKGDKYFKFHDADGNRKYDMTKLATDDPLKRDIIEFDICLPTGACGYKTQIKYYDYANDKGDTIGGEYIFKTEGIYNYRTGELIIPWDGNKWHHVAIVSPGIVNSDAAGVEYDTNVSIYVDGILAWEKDFGSIYKEPYGIRYCQTNGLCPQEDFDESNDGVSAGTKNWTTFACYLDNIRWTNDDLEDIISYNTLSKVESDEYDVDTNGGTITVMAEDATIKNIIDSLKVDKDASIRVYDANGTLVSNYDVPANGGYTVVAADTNGTTTERTYAYYDIRVIADNTYAFDVPYIEKDKSTGDSVGVVKLFNKTGSKKTYNVYIALYDVDGSLELVKHKLLEVDDDNVGEITTDSVIFEEDKKVKLFVWEEDGIKPALLSTLLDK